MGLLLPVCSAKNSRGRIITPRVRKETYGTTLRARLVEVDADAQLAALAQGRGGARGGGARGAGGARAVAGGGGRRGRGRLLHLVALGARGRGLAGIERGLRRAALHLHVPVSDVGADAGRARRREPLRACEGAALPGLARAPLRLRLPE